MFKHASQYSSYVYIGRLTNTLANYTTTWLFQTTSYFELPSGLLYMIRHRVTLIVSNSSHAKTTQLKNFGKLLVN